MVHFFLFLFLFFFLIGLKLHVISVLNDFPHLSMAYVALDFGEFREKVQGLDS